MQTGVAITGVDLDITGVYDDSPNSDDSNRSDTSHIDDKIKITIPTVIMTTMMIQNHPMMIL